MLRNVAAMPFQRTRTRKALVRVYTELQKFLALADVDVRASSEAAISGLVAELLEHLGQRTLAHTFRKREDELVLAAQDAMRAIPKRRTPGTGLKDVSIEN